MSTNDTAADTNGKGKAFFDRGDQVAETANWDYAIEMYLQGILKEPQNIERGHDRLHKVSLARKANGGKGPGLLEGMKRKKSSGDPVQDLVNAEWLMSRDPVGEAHWRQIIEAARTAKLPDVVRWAGQILFEVNRTSKKPNKATYAFLTDAYASMELYSEAVRACGAALAQDPQNGELQDRMRDLSARETMQKGKYEQGASFTESVKGGIKEQVDTVKRDAMSQDERFKLEQVERARAGYEAEPTVPGKVNALVDALLRFEDEAYENEAVDVLTKAHADTGTYRFKMRIGDIRIRQMTRRYQKLAHAGDTAAAKDVARQQLAFELQEYAERAANYPTDLSLKYELGRRQFIAGQYDDAIGSLQQAKRDPKHRLQAMNQLGLAFFRKGWNTEAVETFTDALQGELPESRQKELRYNLAQVYQAMGRKPEAMAQLSEVAQMDFNFKDVREQVERLRAELAGGETPA